MYCSITSRRAPGRAPLLRITGLSNTQLNEVHGQIVSAPAPAASRTERRACPTATSQADLSRRAPRSRAAVISGTSERINARARPGSPKRRRPDRPRRPRATQITPSTCRKQPPPQGEASATLAAVIGFSGPKAHPTGKGDDGRQQHPGTTRAGIGGATRPSVRRIGPCVPGKPPDQQPGNHSRQRQHEQDPPPLERGARSGAPTPRQPRSRRTERDSTRRRPPMRAKPMPAASPT